MRVRPFVALALLATPLRVSSAQNADPRLEKLKAEALTAVEGKAKMVQEIVDMVFSFGELGFQEFETSKYLTGILEQNGFKVERGVAGIPTAWVARWGSGKPVISETSVTGIPAVAIALRVPPVEMISTPRAASAAAKSVRPVLSNTDSNARRSGTRSGGGTEREVTIGTDRR